MILFPLQFQTDIEGTRELCFRGSAAWKDGALCFSAGDTASFDTYFNLLSHEKYAKYCGISAAKLCLSGHGKFCAKLFCKTETGDELLKSAEFCDTLALSFAFPAGGGFLWFSLESQEGGEIFSGAFEADIPEPDSVKIGIVICTFKREEFVARNMERVQRAVAASPVWAERLHFFIVDNAKTLKLPESPLYTVYPNKNLGGSGGFTRGINEVCKDSSCTHFLLMDDDISFEFATLERTYNLLCALTAEHKSAAVGGAMLTLEQPTVQLELGAKFTGLRLLSRNHRYELTDVDNLLHNEEPTDANFTGWWYCCMPVSFVREYGLPMPFFIKGDDTEYGMRCIRDLILINGIGIWHRDFSYKYNYALEYYRKRNEQIAATIHLHGRMKSCIRLMYDIFLHLTLKRYDCAELILRAFEDFFRGCAYIGSLDAEALNTEIMAHKPIWEELPALEQCRNFSAQAIPREGEKRRSALQRAIALVAVNYLPSCFHKNTAAICDANEKHLPLLLLSKTTVHCDPEQGRGYVCTLDTKRRAKIRRKAWKYFLKLLFGFGRISRDYRTNYRSICSAEAWNKRFFF